MQGDCRITCTQLDSLVTHICVQMLGVRSQRRNPDKRPEDVRGAAHAVEHPDGDLDAYVVQFDLAQRFGGTMLKPLWNALSRRMHKMMPLASGAMVEALQLANVRGRLYSAAAADVVSHDLLVNNVGVSAAYQSPPHFDVSDVYAKRAFQQDCTLRWLLLMTHSLTSIDLPHVCRGWTFAFAIKCGQC